MDIKSAHFIKGIRGTDPILKSNISHIAFVGRSNVGKSSVINSLTGIRNLALSSGKPGKTQEINIFLVNNKVFFVDLPGYGFAHSPNKIREKLRKLIIWYLTYLEVKQKLVVLILDAYVGVTPLDQEMIQMLNDCSVRYVIVANKIDKLSAREQKSRMKNLSNLFTDENIFMFSAKNKIGRKELLDIILK